MDLVEMLFNNAINAEGGGGGSGDTSVATVTIQCKSGVSSSIIPIIDEEYGQVMVINLNLFAGVGKTYKVPLYTNGAYVSMEIKDGTTPRIVGNAVYEDGGFIITGDCTILVECDGAIL